MKCPVIKSTMENTKEKSSAAAAAESKVLYLNDSPKKEPVFIKAKDPPGGVMTVLFPTNIDTSAVHDKENSAGREHDGTLDDCLEDSGYLSWHNSQIEPNGEEDDRLPGMLQGKNSPSKYQGRTRLSFPGSLVVSTPVDRHRRSSRAALWSTPTNQHTGLNLPILKFQRDVNDELAKSYKKNKCYDFSVISKIAEAHHLDRVIGRQIGLEYIDVFASLHFKNMKIILTQILSLLGDLDLISCRKVSKTWEKIICEDSAALRRCRQAEQALRESRSSRRERASDLTRDEKNRVVLSCMQTLASSSTPSSSQSSSTQSCRASRHTASSQHTRFDQYMQAASTLKWNESLRSCRRCRSPAIQSEGVQRAKCTRSSCLFEFCTQCQEPFHGSTPCRTVRPHSPPTISRTTRTIPGSKRSVRRL